MKNRPLSIKWEKNPNPTIESQNEFWILHVIIYNPQGAIFLGTFCSPMYQMMYLQIHCQIQNDLFSDYTPYLKFWTLWIIGTVTGIPVY
jgi:hypothetical protein